MIPLTRPRRTALRRSVRRVSVVRDAAPNLAPLVDVVMVILIFMMLGSSFVFREAALATQLPQEGESDSAGTVEIIPAVRIQLHPGIAADGCRIELMGRMLPEDDGFPSLTRALREKRGIGAKTGERVVLSAGASVRYQHVISAMDACVTAGYRDVQFAISSTEGRDKSRAGGT